MALGKTARVKGPWSGGYSNWMTETRSDGRDAPMPFYCSSTPTEPSRVKSFYSIGTLHVLVDQLSGGRGGALGTDLRRLRPVYLATLGTYT